MVKGIKALAALLDDDDKSNGLLGAARGLANAFSNLLDLLKPGEGKVDTFQQIISDPFFGATKLPETWNLLHMKKIRNSFFHHLVSNKHTKNNFAYVIKYVHTNTPP